MLRFVFGQSIPVVSLSAESIQLDLPHRVFSGGSEVWPTACTQPFTRGDIKGHADDEWMSGAAVWPSAPGDLESTTRHAYEQIFDSLNGRSLYRVWHFVPHILQNDPRGEENYRVFNRGRWTAFNARYGDDFCSKLPAASAVGMDAPYLAIAFLAGQQPGRPVENPFQVPAYHYPPDYGRKPPCFARATIAPPAADRELVFISGTAAIRGHSTVAPDSLDAQTKYTLENLSRISDATHVGADIGRSGGWERRIKVYLKHSSDFSAAQHGLRDFLLPSDQVTYIQADICRPDLLIEIEVSLLRTG